MGVTYDTGALIAAERGQRRVWARHDALLQRRVVPTVPAAVLAQAWRDGDHQALLSRLLSGWRIEALDEAVARRVGVIISRAGSSDIVDAAVVEGALRRADSVVTSDPQDIAMIAEALDQPLAMIVLDCSGWLR